MTTRHGSAGFIFVRRFRRIDLDLVDDKVKSSGSLSHIAPASFFTILLTGRPMLISMISVLVFHG